MKSHGLDGFSQMSAFRGQIVLLALFPPDSRFHFRDAASKFRFSFGGAFEGDFLVLKEDFPLHHRNMQMRFWHREALECIQ